MRIKIIVPIISDMFNEQIREEVKNYGSKDVEFDIEELDYGTESIECEYDEALAVPNILDKAIMAEKDGFDGIFIDCFGDPGVRPAREVVDIPVFGGFEPSILLGAGLGDHLGIVTILPTGLPIIEGSARRLQINNRIVCYRYVNIPVLDLGDINKLKSALYEQSLEAIEKNDAHVIILGCTGMMGMAKQLHKRLADSGYDVPVIDPAYAGIKLLETYISMGLKHSKQTYMTPREKKRKLMKK